MALKSLESTFIYNHLNRSSALTNNISGLLHNGITVTKDQIDEPLMIINKNFKYPLKFKVLDAFNSGKIILKFSATNAKLPTCLPFFLTRNAHGGIIAVVSIDIYGSMDKDTQSIKIDPKKLYCMMEGAYLAILSYENQHQLSTRTALINHGSAIYSLMFTRTLNKKYALNIDKSKYHKVMMLASKFFMINILGMKDNELTFNYAIKNCPNGNVYSLKEMNEIIPTEAFNDINTFISALADPKNGLNLKGLNTRNYLEAFITMYDGSNLLSLESFPYFIYNVMSVTNGAYINNQYVLETIVDNHGAKIYNDLLNIDK